MEKITNESVLSFKEYLFNEEIFSYINQEDEEVPFG